VARIAGLSAELIAATDWPSFRMIAFRIRASSFSRHHCPHAGVATPHEILVERTLPLKTSARMLKRGTRLLLEKYYISGVLCPVRLSIGSRLNAICRP